MIGNSFKIDVFLLKKCYKIKLHQKVLIMMQFQFRDKFKMIIG
jgi:hypothetical protein